MKVAIIYHTYLDAKGEVIKIGGIESYMTALGSLVAELGWQPVVIQVAEKTFVKRVSNIEVHGIQCAGLSRQKQKVILFEEAKKRINPEVDIIVFAADHFSVPCDSPRGILLQHGITWDLPIKYMTKRPWLMSRFGEAIKRATVIRKALRDFGNTQTRVCVDYNFLNWYRTLSDCDANKSVYVIPNFALEIATKRQIAASQRSIERQRIIFARRFTDYRGVRLVADAAQRLLSEHEGLEITFAGEGPEKDWLAREFADEERIMIMSYQASESLKVHLNHDIAVVPSLGSEGTSLSLAEAMGAGCAVVATNIGGITNMILDGYNGILCNPDSSSVYRALDYLIRNPEAKESMANQGWETVNKAFSHEKWKKAWTRLLLSVAHR